MNRATGNLTVRALILTTIALGGSAVSCFARLGETFADCQTRYGFPVEVRDGTRADYPQYCFEKDGITVRIRFLNGKSAQEIFSGNGAKMDVAAADILNGNAEGALWSSTTVGQGTSYTRQDGQATAQYRRSKNKDGRAILAVQTAEFDKVFNASSTGF